MSYQVLARKWRPRTFPELVGQEHVVQALVNGLDNDRLHHAFLFTGTRGVGKTTIARILAKALNCEKGVSSEPCGECQTCSDVDDGRFVDLIEVDAASRTKVDDTRELLDNVQYAPSRGRYKVYLIDEVHMLSMHSFNALLKTLEEPPPHVKFLLATTDPQKLPVTVLSRCLQFNLKRLDASQISGYLERVTSEEGVSGDADSLAAIAAAADGSMRDALSLLDQAIAYGGGKLEASEIRRMLGTVEQRHIQQLLAALSEGDGESLWTIAQDLAAFGPNFGAVLRDLAAALHRISLIQLVPKVAEEPGSGDEALQPIADSLSPEDVQLAYEIAVQGRAQLDLAPDPKSGFEMALLRMLAFRPAGTGGPGDSRRSASTSPAPEAAPAVGKGAKGKATASAESVAAEPPTSLSSESATTAGDWGDLIQRLGLKGPAALLAANSVLKNDGPKQFRLLIAREQSHLRTAGSEKKIKAALSRLVGKDAVVRFVEIEQTEDSPAARQSREAAERQQRAEDSIENDPLVRNLKNQFDATVIADSVKPLNN